VEDPIVITGIGMITPLAVGRDASWRLMKAGVSAIRRVRLVTGDEVVGGPAPWNGHGEQLISARAASMALWATGEALQDARLDLDHLDRDRVGCVLGATGCPSLVALDYARRGEATHWCNAHPNMVTATVARHFGLHGPTISPAAACATGLFAVLRGAQCIQDGYCDVVLAGSADASLDIFTVSGFRQLRVLAEDETDPPRACRPFDRNRCGFVIGEGAAVFVLERLSHARRRDASIYAVLAGGVTGSDAYHVTGLNPDPGSIAWLIRQSLRRCHLSPSDVQYVNAHGTATKLNDLTEALAIRDAFGAAAERLKVSATKSMIGHLICAAGGVELAVTALAVRDGYIPPTANLKEPDPECALDCTPNEGQPCFIEGALKLSIAFGGHVGIAVLRHPSCYGRLARQAA
jgi:3-oxoacyl-[acyl-carrier-protein] synthase II